MPMLPNGPTSSFDARLTSNIGAQRKELNTEREFFLAPLLKTSLEKQCLGLGDVTSGLLLRFTQGPVKPGYFKDFSPSSVGGPRPWIRPGRELFLHVPNQQHIGNVLQ